MTAKVNKIHRDSLTFWQRMVLTHKKTPYRDGYFYMVELPPLVDKTTGGKGRK